MSSNLSNRNSDFDTVSTLDMIFENSPAYLSYLRGPNFIIDRINRNALALIGNNNVIGKPVLEVLPEVEAQGYIQILTQVYEKKETFYGKELPLDLVNTSGGPKKLFIDFIYQPLLDKNGQVVGVVSQGYDVTEKVLLRQKLEQYNQNLEKTVEERTRSLKTLNEELEAFSYSVSHDLRTPLRSIEGFSQALLEDESPNLSSRGKNDLQRVIDASQTMGKLIDDLLTLSRLGRKEMVSKPVEMSELANEIINQLQSKEPLRQVEFIIGPLPTVIGDSGLIRVALENLLSNAWKFTSKTNLAKISLTYEKMNDASVFVLKDNGAGFDMDHYGKLFGAFQRLHKTSEFKGTGIGLALVRRIINRHHGEIRAESRVQEGATFYFNLPLAE